MIEFSHMQVRDEPVRVHPRLLLWLLFGMAPFDVGFVGDVKMVGEQGWGVAILVSERDTICPEGLGLFLQSGQDRATSEPVWMPAWERVPAKVHCIDPHDSRPFGGKVEVRMLPSSLRNQSLSDHYASRWSSISHRSAQAGFSEDSVLGLLEDRQVMAPTMPVDFGVCRGGYGAIGRADCGGGDSP